MSNSSRNLIPIAIIVAALIIGGIFFYINQQRKEEGILSPQAAAEKAIDFINQHLLGQRAIASLRSVAQEEDLYKIIFELEGQEHIAYITKNATLLFPQVINLREEPQVQEVPAEPQVEIDRDIEQLKTFAKCLNEKGVKFYGTHWCGFCTRQKAMFGEAAEYLPYIECSDDKATEEELAKCQQANVGPIPDWRFPDGHQELGMLPLEKLAELSGCQL